MAGEREWVTGGPRYVYMTGETLATPSSAAANVPSEATMFVIATEGQAANFNINQGFADPNSPGYLAANAHLQVGPLVNLNSLHVTSAGNVHIMYFREI